MSSSPRALPQFALIFAVLLLPRASAAATGTYTPPMLRGDLSIGYDGGIAAIQLEDRSNDDSAWVEVAEYQKHHHGMQISGAFTPYHGISVGSSTGNSTGAAATHSTTTRSQNEQRWRAPTDSTTKSSTLHQRAYDASASAISASTSGSCRSLSMACPIGKHLSAWPLMSIFGFLRGRTPSRHAKTVPVIPESAA